MKNGGKQKQGSAKNKGYIGYHTTWDGIKVFLRSKAEFIYARVLDYEQIHYKVECVTYKIKDKQYKPDFFIFDDNYKTISKIVEIKGLDDKKTALDYLNRFKSYFDSIGIEYDVIWKYQGLITKYNLQNEIEEWIMQSITNYDFISDTRGENNPMYGRQHSQYTKDLISKRAKERQTPEFRKKNSEAQLQFWQTERGKQRKLEISAHQSMVARQKNPIVDKQCIECSNIFKDKLKSKKEFCTGKCKRKWSYANIPGYGKHKKKEIKNG